MQRLYKFHLCHLVIGYSLALCLEALLAYKLLNIHTLCRSALVLAAKGYLQLRISVVCNCHKIRALGIGDKWCGNGIAPLKGEAFYIEGLHFPIVVDYAEGLLRIKLLYAHHLALIAVAKVVVGGVEGSVFVDCKNMIVVMKLSKIESVLLLVEPVYGGIKPDRLAAYCRDTLGFERYLVDWVL